MKKSPLFESLAFVNKTDIVLWAHTDKVTNEVINFLNQEGCRFIRTCVTIEDFADSYTRLETYANEQGSDAKILVSKPSVYLTGASYAVYGALPEEMSTFKDSPIIEMKGQKNEVRRKSILH